MTIQISAMLLLAFWAAAELYSGENALYPQWNSLMMALGGGRPVIGTHVAPRGSPGECTRYRKGGG
ncbi:MAG: hypothetical protein MR426_06085 [Clostridiales bacterium]|nr:hypothetical protein [Clostridiales bacterium]